MKKIAVVRFPGSNCDQDSVDALRELGAEVKEVWHKESFGENFDGVLVPGGFSYGDYLRAGAMAAHSPISKEIKNMAKNGKKVLGICNGFQILTELGLLPGALLQNQEQKFICKDVELTYFEGDQQKLYNFPIAHMEGRYYCCEEDFAELKRKNQVAFQYKENPNGASYDIAGVRNQEGNVLGLMPHPERATLPIHFSQNGSQFLKEFYGL